MKYEVCETLVYNRGIDLMYRLNRLVFPCITGEGEREREREGQGELVEVCGGLIVGYEQVQYVGISYNLDETS